MSYISRSGVNWSTGNSAHSPRKAFLELKCRALAVFFCLIYSPEELCGINHNYIFNPYWGRN